MFFNNFSAFAFEAVTALLLQTGRMSKKSAGQIAISALNEAISITEICPKNAKALGSNVSRGLVFLTTEESANTTRSRTLYILAIQAPDYLSADEIGYRRKGERGL